MGKDSEMLKDIIMDANAVRNKLQALRPDKAARLDDMSLKLLRELSDELYHTMSLILQKSLNGGLVPND